ncbi:MAG: hypothetical protein QOI03_2159 [Solirubrobacteraceae bacterium]|nr:hypothetical protein [Solirubrobacteraceae bacterium]
MTVMGRAIRELTARNRRALVLAVLTGCCTLGLGLAMPDGLKFAAGRSAARAPLARGVRFIGSVDTMKLSRDRAGNLGAVEIHRVVDLLGKSLNTTHVTDDADLEQPSVIEAWANRIHADGKRVWFRPNSATCSQAHGDLGDGYPSYRPGYLTKLHDVMRAHPGFFISGDILDGDPEVENSCWWAQHYGCGLQTHCRPCNRFASNLPCAPIRQFNAFLAKMTAQENRDLAAMGIVGVSTNVHSTDPGTAMTILTPGLVRSMGNLVTIDAYPDQNTTEPAAAASAWRDELARWHRSWLRRGLNVSILIGEWGYSNAINVDDATQRAVIEAEVSRAFKGVPYLVGTNYWVGPGTVGDGGHTEILRPNPAGVWQLRPAAAVISRFYAGMNEPRPPRH